MIYGIQPVRERLAAGAPIGRILLAEGRGGPPVEEIRQLARQRGVPCVRRPRAELDRLSGGATHQGVVAETDPVGYVAAAELLSAPRQTPFFLVLDGVEDPRNLGAALRTAAAAGVDGVFLPARRSAGLGPTVVKASAGTAGLVPVSRVPNLTNLVKSMKKKGIWVIAVEAGGDPVWSGFDLREPLALVLGGEGRGIGRLLRKHCDAAVGLPMVEGVESLNVSVALGIAAFEVRHQRLFT